MCGRVRHASLFEDGETAFGGDENLVADVVLTNEVAEELFVDACCVDNLTIVSVTDRIRPENSLLTAVSQNVQPSSIALRSTGSACSGVRLVPRPKERPIAPKPGVLTSMPEEPKGSVWTMIDVFLVRISK